MTKPYIEELGKKESVIRTFTAFCDESELVWHRDHEDRLIRILHNEGWMLQFDNEIPEMMSKYEYIPKDTYHKVHKGFGDLKVEIFFLDSKIT